MPNWIEGTMKLRGKREDIHRFFKEGLEPSSWTDETDNKLEDQVQDDSDEDLLWFNFKDQPHIVGTRRAFITDDCVEMSTDEGVACVNIKQAWCFTTEGNVNAWKEISAKFNVDIKLFGIECGMRFEQEIIIRRGSETIINEKKYEDWDWECPFPNMGG